MAAGRHYRCCSRYGCRQEIINMFSLRLQADNYRCFSRYGCRQEIINIVLVTAAGRKLKVLFPLRLQADICYGCRQTLQELSLLRLQADNYRCCSRYGCRQAGAHAHTPLLHLGLDLPLLLKAVIASDAMRR
jgi:hypothetical protein